MTSTCPSTSIQCLPAVKRGDTWRISCEWKDSSGGPIDLSSATIKMQVRHARSKALLAEADSYELAKGEDMDVYNVVTAIFLPETTALVAPGTHYTDMQVTHSADDVVSSATLALPVLLDQTY